MLLPHIEGDPSLDYGLDFVDAWKRTENYRIWNTNTDSHLFDIVEPKHPCAGGLTIDDVQRRITQQVQDLHLDERFAVGKEVLGRNLAAGREKASTMFNKLYADMESLREAQRKRAEEAKSNQNNEEKAAEKNAASTAPQTIGVKAGAFVNSWAAWAGEKRKAAGWGRASTTTTNESQSNRGGGWAGWGKASNTNRQSSYAKMENNESGAWTPRAASSSSSSTAASPGKQEQRALNRGSLSGESMFDAAGSESGMSSPVSPRRRPLSADATGPAPTASIPVIDAVVSAAVAVDDKKAGQNGTTMTPDATTPTSTPTPTIEKKEATVTLQPAPTIEEDAPSPPLTPVPVAVAAAEAAEAQNVWGR